MLDVTRDFHFLARRAGFECNGLIATVMACRVRIRVAIRSVPDHDAIWEVELCETDSLPSHYLEPHGLLVQCFELSKCLLLSLPIRQPTN